MKKQAFWLLFSTPQVGAAKFSYLLHRCHRRTICLAYYNYASDHALRTPRKASTTTAISSDLGSILVALLCTIDTNTSRSVFTTACKPSKAKNNISATRLTNTAHICASRLIRLGRRRITRRLKPSSAISLFSLSKNSRKSLSSSVFIITVLF